jgi:hypothetical protein
LNHPVKSRTSILSKFDEEQDEIVPRWKKTRGWGDEEMQDAKTRRGGEGEIAIH